MYLVVFDTFLTLILIWLYHITHQCSFLSPLKVKYNKERKERQMGRKYFLLTLV